MKELHVVARPIDSTYSVAIFAFRDRMNRILRMRNASNLSIL